MYGPKPLVLFFALLASVFAASQTSFQPRQEIGPGSVIVHSKFGGQIFGFDIDQNGTEGVLSEALTLANGNILAAVETFDQSTGAILDVLAETQTQDDFITLGVVGQSVGLIDHEHEISFLHLQRTFHSINPLDGNKFTGNWTPPIGTQHLIEPTSVSRNQGKTNVAVFAYDNSGNFVPWVFESNVATNQFSPIVKITDSLNFGSVVPPMAFDSTTNQAILGGGDGCFGCFPVIGIVNFAKLSFSEFTGIGFGFVNGMAVDSADGVFCTTTEDDANIEFYDLATEKGFIVGLPGAGGQQIFSGADVEFDAVNKLFLIAQPVSSSARAGSTIYVYDIKGNLQETLNGFSFSNAFNVVPAHIALNPGNRSGFIDGPDSGVNEIESFTY
jgi:hypothetical protein